LPRRIIPRSFSIKPSHHHTDTLSAPHLPSLSPLQIMPLKVTIALGKDKVVELDLSNKNATVQDLKEAFAKKVRCHALCACPRPPSLSSSLRHALFLFLPPSHLMARLHSLSLTPPSLPSSSSPQIRRLSPSRQSFRLPADPSSTSASIKLDKPTQSLAEAGYKEGMVLVFKDLGPQVSFLPPSPPSLPALLHCVANVA